MEIKKCSVGSCGRPHVARGYCAGHWSRWRKTGSVIEEKVFVKQVNKLFTKCENHLCGKIIWVGQYRWGNMYCSEDCEQEAHHWRSVTSFNSPKNPSYIRVKKKKTLSTLSKELSTYPFLTYQSNCNTL